MSDLLEVSGISKSFDGFKAINNLSFSIGQAELRAIIGPNGAGKTTLVDAITGLVPATGSITKSGEQLLGKKVHKIARLGVEAARPHASKHRRLTRD